MIDRLVFRSFYLLYSVIAVFVVSCTSPCEDLSESINKALLQGNDITQQEYKEIQQEIGKNLIQIQRCEPGLFSGNEINEEALDAFISDQSVYLDLKNQGITPAVFSSNRSIKEVSSKFTINPTLYLERSGSMVFYDKVQGEGQFKSNLVKLLNNFSLTKPSKSLVYIVNDNVYPFDKSFQDFIQIPDIFIETRDVGNPNYTDFDTLYRSVIANTAKYELSILVSDFIYSTPLSGEKNPIRIQEEVDGLMTNIFNQIGDDKAFLVAKFYGDYNGTYYDYRDVKHSYDGLRPYYMSFFANNETMLELIKNAKYEKIVHFPNYKLFDHFYLFINQSNQKAPAFTILKNDPDNEGSFRQDSEELKLRSAKITKIQKAVPDKVSGRFAFSVALDLSEYFVDDKTLENPSNYRLSNSDHFEVVSIEKVTDYPGYTHKMVVQSVTGFIPSETLQITLLNQFPTWIEASSTLDDTNVEAPNFEHTTFAFEGMMRGIYQAYFKNIETPKYFDINIAINQ